MPDIFDRIADSVAQKKDIFDYVAEGQKLDGDKARITGDIAATQDRLNQPADLVKNAAPQESGVMSLVKNATAPGGIASSENLGMLGGGAAGAMYGSAFGPAGTFLGGLLGAGAGAMGGRGYELTLDKLYGGSPSRSATDVVGELGNAANSGMISQATGEGVGALLGRVGKAMIAPFSSKFGPEAKRATEIAKELGITATPGQILGSGRLSRIEGIAKHGISGAEASYNFGKQQAAETQQAAYNFAESMAPGLGKDLETVGDFTKAAAEGRLDGMRKMVGKLFSQVSDGKTLSLKQAGETVQQSKDKLFEAVKGYGGKLYNAVKVAAGDAANSIESPEFYKWAQSIAAKEAELRGVQTRAASVASGAASVMKPKESVVSVGDKIQQAMGDDLPLSLVKQYGLAEPKTWTLDALREWQSRLGGLIGSTKDRRVSRDLSGAFAAVSKDIENWGDKLPTDVNGLLKTANDFWRTRVADVYYNRLVGSIDKAEPDLVASLFLGPQVSTTALERVKNAIGVPAFQKAVGSYMDDIFTKANNLDGTFSPTKALQIFQSHDADVLKQMFGKNLSGEELIVKMFQRNPTKMIEGVMQRDGEQILQYLVPKGGSVEPLRQLRQLLSNEKYDQFAGAFLKNVTDKSVDETGAFSLRRFLTQVNGPAGYTQNQLRSLLGDNYGRLKEMTDLFSRMESNSRFSGNPSGTSHGIMSNVQMGGAIAIGFDALSSTMSGKEDFTRLASQAAGGFALMSPNLVAKAMYSKGGIKWLTQGFAAPPGSQAGKTAIANLAKVLVAPQVGVTQGNKNENISSIQDEIKKTLQDGSSSLQAKINAAMMGSKIGGIADLTRSALKPSASQVQQ